MGYELNQPSCFAFSLSFKSVVLIHTLVLLLSSVKSENSMLSSMKAITLQTMTSTPNREAQVAYVTSDPTKMPRSFWIGTGYRTGVQRAPCFPEITSPQDCPYGKTYLFTAPRIRPARLQSSIVMRTLPGRPVSLKKELKSSNKVVTFYSSHGDEFPFNHLRLQVLVLNASFEPLSIVTTRR